ncbi:MAG: hypothetical protein KKE94_06425 [Gammaproteobacteria bacterium]|nr:hypothetical protein [Gammaproteobacteria bacterium]
MSSSEIESLNCIINILAQGLTQEDRNHCWTDDARIGIHNYFESTKSDISNGKKCPAINGLIRGLDSWGISSGELFESCLLANRKLRDAGHAK